MLTALINLLADEHVRWKVQYRSSVGPVMPFLKGANLHWLFRWSMCWLTARAAALLRWPSWLRSTISSRCWPTAFPPSSRTIRFSAMFMSSWDRKLLFLARISSRSFDIDPPFLLQELQLPLRWRDSGSHGECARDWRCCLQSSEPFWYSFFITPRPVWLNFASTAVVKYFDMDVLDKLRQVMMIVAEELPAASTGAGVVTDGSALAVSSSSSSSATASSSSSSSSAPVSAFTYTPSASAPPAAPAAATGDMTTDREHPEIPLDLRLRTLLIRVSCDHAAY